MGVRVGPGRPRRNVQGASEDLLLLCELLLGSAPSPPELGPAAPWPALLRAHPTRDAAERAQKLGPQPGGRACSVCVCV